MFCHSACVSRSEPPPNLTQDQPYERVTKLSPEILIRERHARSLGLSDWLKGGCS